MKKSKDINKLIQLYTLKFVATFGFFYTIHIMLPINFLDGIVIFLLFNIWVPIVLLKVDTLDKIDDIDLDDDFRF